VTQLLAALREVKQEFTAKDDEVQTLQKAALQAHQEMRDLLARCESEVSRSNALSDELLAAQVSTVPRSSHITPLATFPSSSSPILLPSLLANPLPACEPTPGVYGSRMVDPGPDRWCHSRLQLCAREPIAFVLPLHDRKFAKFALRGLKYVDSNTCNPPPRHRNPKP
jgi:hypothetical protein